MLKVCITLRKHSHSSQWLISNAILNDWSLYVHLHPNAQLLKKHTFCKHNGVVTRANWTLLTSQTLTSCLDWFYKKRKKRKKVQMRKGVLLGMPHFKYLTLNCNYGKKVNSSDLFVLWNSVKSAFGNCSEIDGKKCWKTFGFQEEIESLSFFPFEMLKRQEQKCTDEPWWSIQVGTWNGFKKRLYFWKRQ